MADKPEAGEQKNDAENAAENPAAPADARSDQKKPDDEKPAAEEVEAEIVDDGHGRPEEPARPGESETARDDGADASEAPRAAPRRNLGSPGVILLVVFIVIALILAALWRFGSGRPDETAAASPATASGEQADPADPPSPSDASEEPATGGADAAKIANDAVAAKPPAGASRDAGGRGLPPAPPSGTGANDAIRRAAKDAARLAPQPGPEEDVGDAIDLGAAFPGGTAADSDGAGAQAAEEYAGDKRADEAGADDAGGGEPEALQTGEAAAENAGAGLKIANDLEAVKTALEAETRRLEEMLAQARADNEAQAAEIAALRDSVQAAILERDRRAQAEIADLRAQLDKIQSGDGIPSGRRAAAALALLSLKNAIDSGDPYKDELELLSRLAPDAAQIEVLRARAETGAPTRETLKARFGPLAREALAAAGQARAKGPIGAMMARLEALVSVRPAAPIAGDTPAAVVSRAEARLEEGALEAAVSELEALQGEAAAVFAPWLADARARLAADRALDGLNAAILREYLN